MKPVQKAWYLQAMAGNHLFIVRAIVDPAMGWVAHLWPMAQHRTWTRGIGHIYTSPLVSPLFLVQTTQKIVISCYFLNVYRNGNLAAAPLAYLQWKFPKGNGQCYGTFSNPA